MPTDTLPLSTPSPQHLPTNLSQNLQAVAVLDNTFRLIAWNPAFEALAQHFSNHPVAGMLPDTLLPWTRAAGFRWQPGYRGEVAGFHLTLERLQNETHLLTITPASPAAPPPPEVSLTAPDTTLAETQATLSRTLKQLKRSEKRLRLISDTIPALIAYFDREQIYRYANQGYAHWFGLSENEVIGASIAHVIGEKGYQSSLPYIEKALAGEKVSYEYTMRQNKRWVHARSTLVPEINPDGRVPGCFVLSFDTTELKRMQEALVQAQKMEAIGQLTGGLAHDFNNLLTIIIGNLSCLEETTQHPETLELLGPALQAARQGAQLIRRLLSFSRQQPLKPVVVHVGQLIGTLDTLIRRSLPASILFTTDLGDTPLHARVDPGQLESALLNFVLNARDAMPSGGKLTLSTRAIPLEGVQAEELGLPPATYLKIEVQDTGCGMDEATQGRIFEPFFTTKSFGHGSGLGLSMVYGFARQSGGCVKVQSEPGHGSTFSMLLPSVAAENTGQQPPEAHILGTSRNSEPVPGLVLLVEDDPNVRRVVRAQLLELGYPVLEAENGTQAAEMLSQVQDIAILLTDIIMPGSLNGRELAQHARQVRPDLHIVLMSGYEEQMTLNPGDQACPPLLSKPFTKRELSQALHT